MPINWIQYPDSLLFNTDDKIIVSEPSGNTKNLSFPFTSNSSGITFTSDIYFTNLTEQEEEFSVMVGPDGKLYKSTHPSERSRLQVRNDEGATIPAGAPLYSKGEIGGSERILVGICNSSDTAKMPCIGVAEFEMNTTSTKDSFAVTQGVYNTKISGFTGLSLGDTLYVNGGSAPYLTQTKPTNGDLIQNVGIVLKTNGTKCQGLLVSAIGRTNDVPWPLYVDHANQRVGVGTTSPSEKLHVVGKGIFTDQVTIPATPVTSTDAASKGYVDAQVGASDTLQEVTDNGNTTTNSINIGSSTAPAKKLTVTTSATGDGILGISTDGYTWCRLLNDNSTTTPVGTLRLYYGTSQSVKLTALSNQMKLGDSQNTMTFFTASSEKMRLTSGGNLGIGVTSPALQSGGTGLHINASAHSEIKFTNSTTGTASTDGTAFVSSGHGFTINNREAGSLTLKTNNTTRATIDSAGATTLTGSLTLESTTPTLIFTDTNSDSDYSIKVNGGIFNIRDHTNDVARLSIKSNGNVGIGTTNPSNKLDVNGTILCNNELQFTNSAMRIYRSSDDMRFRTNNTDKLTITSAGRLGIGTTNPPYKLTVQGNAYVYGGNLHLPTSTYGIVNAANTSQKISFPSLGNFSFENVNVGIGTTSPSDYYSDDLVISSADEKGMTIAATTTSATNYIMFADGTSGNEAYRGYVGYNHSSDYLRFGTSGSEKMRLTSTGLGVGTSGPTTKLDVNGGTNNTYLSVRNEGGGYKSGIMLYGGSVGVSHIWQDDSENPPGLSFGNTSGSRLDTPTTQMYIAQAGNVGIGTTSPAGASGKTLEIYGGSGQARLAIKNDDTGGGSGDGFQISLGSGVGGRVTLEQRENSDMAFSTNAAEKMRLTSGGNLLIGTTTGSQKLVVAGNIEVNGSNDSADGLHLKDRTFVAFSDASSVVSRFRSSSTGVFQFQDGSYNTGVDLRTNGTSTFSGGGLTISGGTLTGRTATFKGYNVGATDNLIIQNSAGTKTFSVSNNGQVNIDGSQKLVTSDASIELRNNATGLMSFKSAANYGITFGDNGGEAMRINTSSNNVLIGTTTDNGERLQVDGNARVVTGGNTFLNIHHGNVGFIVFKDNSISAPNEFQIQHNYSQNNDFRISRNTGGTDFVIDNSGNVGIGTASPDAILEISSDSDDGTSAPALRITNASTTLNDGATIGSLEFHNSDLSGGPHTGSIKAVASSSDERTVEFTFNTAQVGSTSERMRLTSDGKLLLNLTSYTGNEDFIINSTTNNGGLKLQRSGVDAIILSRGGTPSVNIFNSSGQQRIRFGENLSYIRDSLMIGSSSSPTRPLHVVNTSSQTVAIFDGGNNSAGEIAFSSAGTSGGTYVTIGAVANDMSFSAGANERMRLTSAGNLGIGTTSPAYKLDLVGGNMQISNGGATWFGSDATGGFVRTFNGNTFRFLDSSLGETMRIVNSTNNVLIGTTTDSGEKLQVYGGVKALGHSGGYYLHSVRGNSVAGANEPFLALLNNSTISSATYGWAWYDSNVDGSLQLWRRNNSTTGNQVLTFNRSNGNATFTGSLAGTTATFSGNLGVTAKDYRSSSNLYLTSSSDWIFRTITGSEKMRLTSTGLGIGTSSPSEKLDVSGNVLVGGGTLSRWLRFKRTDGFQLGFGEILSNGQLKIGGTNVGVISFYRSAGEVMRINGANVLIGTTTDSGQKLQVDGTANFTGSVSFDDNARALFGDVNDLQIWHEGGSSGSYITNYKDNLYIQNNANDKDIIFQNDDGFNNLATYITLDGSQTTINVYKNLLIGTTVDSGLYKIDVAGKQRVQSVLELDDVLTLNAISTPADPASGKSSIYMDSADGAIKVKINVGGTVVTRTLASFE